MKRIKIRCGPAKGRAVRAAESMVSYCQAKQKGSENTEMAQTKLPAGDRSLASLHKATDTLSTLLAQEVKELNARQKAQKAGGGENGSAMKGLKEATAVLKDLAAVAKTLNDQGADAESAECGVVLLPPVESG